MFLFRKQLLPKKPLGQAPHKFRPFPQLLRGSTDSCGIYGGRVGQSLYPPRKRFQMGLSFALCSVARLTNQIKAAG